MNSVGCFSAGTKYNNSYYLIHCEDSMNFKFISLFWVFTLASSFLAANPYTEFPGSIPLKYERTPATDLIYNDEILPPDGPSSAHELHTVYGIDLSMLNPDETTNYWKNTDVLPLNEADDDFEISKSGEEFNYISEVKTPFELFRFTVTKKMSNGVESPFTIMIGKTAHKTLLLKALLRKIGYFVPPTQYIKDFKVRFPGPATRNEFFRRSIPDYAGSPDRWVTNIYKKKSESEDDSGQWDVISENENDDFLMMQDAIVMPSDDHFYNLSLGYMPKAEIGGKRLFNALLVAYNLLDVTESVNLFSWQSARIINEMAYLPYLYANEFSTSYEDARWIIRRIAQLNRTDWEEVTNSGNYPISVSKLLTEKLISRRNALVNIFSIDQPEISFNSNISHENELVNGKLIHREWPGYGSRFSYGDPESPLSRSEVGSFLKSKLFSNVVSNLVNKVNTDYLDFSNIEEAFLEKQIEEAQKAFIKTLKTRQPQDIPFGVWTTPLISGELILSREIVIGSYLGTDNLIQLADSIGFSIDAGLYVGTIGLPVNLFVAGQTRVGIRRTFTHLKPLKSMKVALKEPLKHILVPLLKNEYGQLFDSLLTGDFEILNDEEKQVEINRVLSLFRENLSIGESLIIQDGLTGQVQGNLGYSLADRIKFQSQLKASHVAISRLHILRKDENTIQIYDDKGNITALNAAAGITASRVSTIGFDIQFSAGKAKTDFYNINIDGKLENNPDIVRNLISLRKILLTSDLEHLQVWQSPYQFHHKLKQNGMGLSLLWWRYRELNTKDNISVTAPNGMTKNFFYTSTGRRSGSDFQNFSLQAFNSLIFEYGIDDISILSTSSGDAGDTFLGRSKSRLASFESEYIKSNSEIQLGDRFFQANYRWKGWSAPRDKIIGIIKGLSKRYDFILIPEVLLNDTKKIQLYTLDLSVMIYQRGLDFISQFNKTKLEECFRKANWIDYFHYNQGGLNPNQEHADKERVIRNFFNAIKYYKNAKDKNKVKEMSQYGLEILNIAEQLFDFSLLVELVGGKDNIYVKSKLNGFRIGDESGDSALLSNHFGHFGSKKIDGPLKFLQSNLGLSESELFVYWLINKL